MDAVDNVVDEFSKAELILIAETLGLAPTQEWVAHRIADVIRVKVLKAGIPDQPDRDLTRGEELFEDWLYVAGFIDEDGNEIKQEATHEVSIEEFMSSYNIPKRPSCFSTADDADPACRRCMLYKYCAGERISKLPPCFGSLYDLKNEECKGCLEAPFCMSAMSNNNKN